MIAQITGPQKSLVYVKGVVHFLDLQTSPQQSSGLVGSKIDFSLVKHIAVLIIFLLHSWKSAIKVRIMVHFWVNKELF